METLAGIPVVKAKIRIPRYPDAIPRERLHQLLENDRDAKLQLLIAPAGYGKTVMMASYIAATERRFSWYSLDQDDRDPVVFITYLVESLRRSCPNVGPDTLNKLDITARQAGSIGPAVVNLCRELETYLDQDVTLVLDDFHVILDQEDILRGLDHLIRFSPSQLRLAILSRQEIPLATERLQVEGRLLRIGAGELKLTLAEFGELIKKNIGNATDRGTLEAPRTGEQVEDLYRWSDGWMAPAVLLARSLSSAQPHQAPDPSLWRTYSPSPRTIARKRLFSYVAQEIYNALTDEQQAFARQVSVLEVLTPDLARELTNNAAAGEMIGHLSRWLLLEGGEGSYHFHPLTREFLAERLDAEETPDAVAEIHRRAGRLLEEQGQRRLAVHHYLAARQNAEAVRAAREAVIYMFHEGQLQAAGDMLRSIPRELLETDPILCLHYGRILILRGDHSETYQYFSLAKKLAAERGDTDTLVDACIALANYWYQRHEGGRSVSEVQTAVKLAGRDQMARAMWALADSYLLDSKKTEAFAWYQKSQQTAREAGDVKVQADAAFAMAVIISVKPDLREAERLLREVQNLRHKLIRCPHEVTQPHLLLTSVRLSRGETSAVPRMLIDCQEALRLSREYPNRRHEGWNLLALAMVEAALLDFTSAQRHAQEALAVLEEVHDYLVLPQAMDMLAWIAFSQGELAEALKMYLESVEFQNRHHSCLWLAKTMLNLANLWYLAGDPGRCAEVVNQTESIAGQLGAEGALAGTSLLRSRLAFAEERTEEALAHLRSCFGYIRATDYVGGITSLAAGEAPLLARAFALFAGEEDSSDLVCLTDLVNHLPPGVRHRFFTELMTGETGEVLAKARQLFGRAFPSQVAGVASGNPAAAAECPPVKAYLMGPFQLHIGGRLISAGVWKNKRARAILQYLLVHAERSVPRDEIIETLWPESSPAVGERMFYRCLKSLKEQLAAKLDAGSSLILLREGGYCINPEVELWVDVDEFRKGIDASRKLVAANRTAEAIEKIEEAVNLYRGDLLADCRNEEWADQEREFLQAMYRDSLERVTRLLVEAGEYERGIAYGEKLLALDPGFEEFHRFMMEVFIQMGQPTRAVWQYHRLRRYLTREMGTEPSPETVAVYRRIRS